MFLKDKYILTQHILYWVDLKKKKILSLISYKTDL